VAKKQAFVMKIFATKTLCPCGAGGPKGTSSGVSGSEEEQLHAQAASHSDQPSVARHTRARPVRRRWHRSAVTAPTRGTRPKTCHARFLKHPIHSIG